MLILNFSPRSKVFLNSSCERVKIVSINDDSHYLILDLDEYLTPTVLEHSLPDNEKYFMMSGTVDTYSAIFFDLLDKMEMFYIQMHTIDQLTYVVDPVEVSTKHNYRVIKLGKFIVSDSRSNN